MKIRSFLTTCAVVVLSASALSACVVQPVRVRPPQPEPVIEVVPEIVTPGQHWVKGHYRWEGDHWGWVRGHWAPN